MLNEKLKKTSDLISIQCIDKLMIFEDFLKLKGNFLTVKKKYGNFSIFFYESCLTLFGR